MTDTIEPCTYKCEAWPECGCAPEVPKTADTIKPPLPMPM